MVERVAYCNDEAGFCVLRIKAPDWRDLVAVVGHAASVNPGKWMQMSGSWVNDRVHECNLKRPFQAAGYVTLHNMMTSRDCHARCIGRCVTG